VFVEAGTVANATQCAFNGNTAQQSGGGCFTVGDGSELSITDTAFKSSYSGCCYPAGYGSMLQSNATLTCADVDSDAVADGRSCCYVGEYTDGVSCLPCFQGADCSSSGASILKLPLLPGYWRASVVSTDIRPCPLPTACAGNNSVSSSDYIRASSDSFLTDTMYCATGYRGPCKQLQLVELIDSKCSPVQYSAVLLSCHRCCSA
jgi:hypothetical protein